MDKPENKQPEEDIVLTADALKAMGHPVALEDSVYAR